MNAFALVEHTNEKHTYYHGNTEVEEDKDPTPTPHEWTSFSDADEDKGARQLRQSDWTYFSESEGQANTGDRGSRSGSVDSGSSMNTEDQWQMSRQQSDYYMAQFLRLQPDLSAVIPGGHAKTFFEMSKLPVKELCRIWELSDVDCDGALSLGEFCIAMHLVVLRINGVSVPEELPVYLREMASGPPVKEGDSFLGGSDESGSSGSPSAPAGPKRRLSGSSQSDVSSLAESLIAFDSRPPPDFGSMPHPVAVRPRPGQAPISFVEESSPVTANQSESATRLFPVGPLFSRPKAFSSYCPPDHSPHSNEVPLNNCLIPPALAPSGAEPRTDSVSPSLPPPPPPPRSRGLSQPFTNARGLISIVSTMQPQPSSVLQASVTSSTAPRSRTNYVSHERHDLFQQQASSASYCIGNSDDHRQRYRQEIESTQLRCENLVQVNKELSIEMMKLQQQRIALELKLEHLTPLGS